MKRLFLIIISILFMTIVSSCGAISNYGESSGINQEATPNQGAILSTPIPSIEYFSSGNANRVPPHDILEELSYYGTGGGGVCLQDYQQTTIEKANSSNIGILGTDILITVCGLSPDEEIVIEVERPDGNKSTYTVTAKKYVETMYTSYAADLSYSTQPGYPEGIYTFAVSGKSGSTTYQVAGSREPFFITEPPNTLFLFNFQPYENIRIFSYTLNQQDNATHATFYGWQEYRVNSQGQLRIDVEDAKSAYFIVGDLSGYIGSSYGAHLNILSSSVTSTPQETSKLTCGDLSTRLAVGKKARVTITDGTPLRIRSKPDRSDSSNIIGSIPEGTIVQILDGPECNNGVVWWNVKTSTNIVGWMMEGAGGDSWYLEPWQ